MTFPFPFSTRVASRPSFRATITLGAVLGSLVLTTGCAVHTDIARSAAMHFNADPNLLEPAAATTYYLTGELDTADNSDEASLASPYVHRDAHASGTLIMQDGMLTSVEITATLDTPDDLHFVLNEPVLMERRGEMVDAVIARGTLSTDNAVYPGTRVVFTPSHDDTGIFLHASIDVPDSLTQETQRTPGNDETINLILTVEPLVTIEDAPSDYGSEPSGSEEEADEIAQDQKGN